MKQSYVETNFNKIADILGSKWDCEGQFVHMGMALSRDSAWRDAIERTASGSWGTKTGHWVTISFWTEYKKILIQFRSFKINMIGLTIERCMLFLLYINSPFLLIQRFTVRNSFVDESINYWLCGHHIHPYYRIEVI